MRFTKLLLGLGLLLLSGCIAAPSGPTPTPNREQLQAQPTPVPPAYSEPFEVLSLDNLEQIGYIGQLAAPPGSGSVFAHAFSNDGTRLAGLTNNTLIVWDVLTGDMLYDFPVEGLLDVFYSPDKTDLYTLTREESLVVYDGETGARRTALTVHPNYVGGPYDYDPDSGLLAVVSIQGDVRVWDLLERQAVANYQADNPDISALAFSPDAARLAFGDLSGTTVVWDWREDTEIATLADVDEAATVRLALAPGGTQVAVATGEDIRLWSLLTSDIEQVLLTGRDGSADVLQYIREGDYLLNTGLAEAMNIWESATGALAVALPELGGEPTAVAFSVNGQVMLTSIFQGDVSLWDLSDIEGEADNLPRATLNVGANIIDVGWSPDGRALALFEAGGSVQVWGIPAPAPPDEEPTPQ